VWKVEGGCGYAGCVCWPVVLYLRLVEWASRKSGLYGLVMGVGVVVPMVMAGCTVVGRVAGCCHVACRSMTRVSLIDWMVSVFAVPGKISIRPAVDICKIVHWCRHTMKFAPAWMGGWMRPCLCRRTSQNPEMPSGWSRVHGGAVSTREGVSCGVGGGWGGVIAGGRWCLGVFGGRVGLMTGAVRSGEKTYVRRS
jgi:hypothetical protein